MSLLPDFFYRAFFFFSFATKYLIYQNLFLCSLEESSLILFFFPLLFLLVALICYQQPHLWANHRGEKVMFLMGIFLYSKNRDFSRPFQQHSVWGSKLSGEDGVIVITQ